MAVVNGKYGYILDVPGNEEDIHSDYGRFVAERRKLTGVSPGDKMHSLTGIGHLVRFPTAEFVYGAGHFVETDFGSVSLGMTFVTDFLDSDGFNQLEDLLRRSSVTYGKNAVPLSLCCAEAVEKTESLLFFNVYGESHLYLTTPVSLFERGAKVYVAERREEDDQLERRLIARWNKMPRGDDEPPVGLTLFPSREEGQKAIDIEVMNSLRETFERGAWWDEKVEIKGCYVSDMKEKYRYPPTLTDTEISSGEGIISVGISVKVILHEYKDGSVVVGQDYDYTPLEIYFDRKEGMHSYSLLGCSSCCGQNYNSLREKARELAVKDMREEENLLVGSEAAMMGYEFDFSRLKVSLGKKRTIEGIRLSE